MYIKRFIIQSYQNKGALPSMKNNSCIGCRTYFEQGEKVPLESMVIQFKNYFLPIKQSKPKYILLKTITGFLNSKGGTIYIGVEDTKGVVVGQKIDKKSQDEFMLFIKFFVQKIKPAVDLVNKQQVSIVYVPVVTNKVFKGKYVIKIIVKQGDPSKTYHFSTAVSLQLKGRTEQIQVFHAFYRHNMGGIAEIRGQALLQQIARKAQKPNEIATTFHKFCNPTPLELGGAITKIGFSGIRKQELRTRFEQIFHKHMLNFDVDYQLTFDLQNQVLLIQLQNEARFKEINQSMKKHLEVLNSSKSFNFVQKGQYLDFYLYKNLAGDYKQEYHSDSQKKQSSPSTKQEVKIQEKQSIIQPKLKQQQEQKEVWEYVAGDSDNQNVSQSKEPRITSQLCQKAANQKQKLICQKSLGQEFTLTITHINSEKLLPLEGYLKDLIKQKSQMKIDKYIHTMQLRFQSRKNVLQIYDLLQKNNDKISQFGVRNNIVIGINMKLIHISHYDRSKRKQLKQYITKKIGGDLQEIDFKKSNNKFFLQLKFKSRELTCSWLDKLLTDGEMKKFIIPGQDSTKLHIYIYCICS